MMETSPIPPIELSPAGIREYLQNIIQRLRLRGIWHYIEPATRGWLELASRLESIKFRSRAVLSVLFKILKRIKPLLDFPGLVASIGAKYAWWAGRLAASWGNGEARKWGYNKGFQVYCGIMIIQLSKLIPNLASSELNALTEFLGARGIYAFLKSLGKLI